VRQQGRLARGQVEDQHAAAGAAVARRAAEDEGLAVGMHQQAGRPHQGRARVGVDQLRVALRVLRVSRHPGAARVPLQQTAAGVHADVVAVVARRHRVPLAQAGEVLPGIGGRVVAEEAHREGRATGDGAIGGRGHAHEVSPLAGVVEGDLLGLAGGRVLDHQASPREVADAQDLAIREGAVEEALRLRDVGLRAAFRRRLEAAGLATVQLDPRVVLAARGLAVDLAVLVTHHHRVGLLALGLLEDRGGRAGLRIQRDDLAGGAAGADVHPAGVVGGNGARVLRPVLFEDVPVVAELLRGRVVRDHAALRVARRPDHALVVFGHAHGHLRCRLADEGELAGGGVILDEVVAEVRVEAVLARQDRGVRAVTPGREGHRHLTALAGLGVDRQEGIAAGVVEEPDEDHVAALAIGGGDRAAVVAHRRRHAVVAKAVAQIDRGGADHRRRGGQQGKSNPRRAMDELSVHAFLLIAPRRRGPETTAPPDLREDTYRRPAGITPQHLTT